MSASDFILCVVCRRFGWAVDEDWFKCRPCGLHHRICRRCQDFVGSAGDGYRLDSCPDTDEIRVAIAVMGG